MIIENITELAFNKLPPSKRYLLNNEDTMLAACHLLEEMMNPSRMGIFAEPMWMQYVLAIGRVNAGNESNIHTGYEKRFQAMFDCKSLIP